jgi:hypothetical protein
VLSDVKISTEIGHSGMQGATGSGVLRLLDNEYTNSSDERNPRLGLTIQQVHIV